MKINLFKYPIGTVVKYIPTNESELWGHVLGFKEDLKTGSVFLHVKWHDGYEMIISPEFVKTYNDL